MEKTITYCGNQRIVKCDEKCNKAWGINNRPKVVLDKDDDDDFYYVPDDELGNAPKNPGTYEGGDGKPSNKYEIPNKWCVGECERCEMVDVGEEMVLPQIFQRKFIIYHQNINNMKVFKDVPCANSDWHSEVFVCEKTGIKLIRNIHKDNFWIEYRLTDGNVDIQIDESTFIIVEKLLT